MVERALPRTIRIIVADDNDEMRMAMVKILMRHFLVIDAVTSGDALVDASVVLTPDVIVSDVMMRHMSGLEAMAALAEAGLRAPFVLVSADTTDALEWIDRGALAVVHKLDLRELTAAVEAAAAGVTYLSTRASRVH